MTENKETLCDSASRRFLDPINKDDLKTLYQTVRATAYDGGASFDIDASLKLSDGESSIWFGAYGYIDKGSTEDAVDEVFDRMNEYKLSLERFIDDIKEHVSEVENLLNEVAVRRRVYLAQRVKDLEDVTGNTVGKAKHK